jgi:hypothetical protein
VLQVWLMIGFIPVAKVSRWSVIYRGSGLWYASCRVAAAEMWFRSGVVLRDAGHGEAAFRELSFCAPAW